MVDAIVRLGFKFLHGKCDKICCQAYRHKDDSLEDLKKARWYLDYEIRKLEEAKQKSLEEWRRPS